MRCFNSIRQRLLPVELMVVGVDGEGFDQVSVTGVPEDRRREKSHRYSFGKRRCSAPVTPHESL